MNDGGQAFPSAAHGLASNFIKGMTLRDYFAAKAMQALLSNSAMCDSLDAPETRADTYIWFTSRAYGLADAMLKAREAK